MGKFKYLLNAVELCIIRRPFQLFSLVSNTENQSKQLSYVHFKFNDLVQIYLIGSLVHLFISKMK